MIYKSIKLYLIGEDLQNIEKQFKPITHLLSEELEESERFRIVITDRIGFEALTEIERAEIRDARGFLNWAIWMGEPSEELQNYSICIKDEPSEEIGRYISELIHTLLTDEAIIKCDLCDIATVSKDKRIDFIHQPLEYLSQEIDRLDNRDVDSILLSIKGSMEMQISDLATANDLIYEPLDNSEANIILTAKVSNSNSRVEVGVLFSY